MTADYIKSVLLVDQYSTIGGGQTVLLDIARVFLGAGWRVDFMIPVGGPLELLIRDQFGEGAIIHDIRPPRMTHGRKTVGDIVHFLCFSLAMGSRRQIFADYDMVYANGGRVFLGVHLGTLGRRERPAAYHIHIGFSRLEQVLVKLLLGTGQTRAVLTNSAFIHRRLVEQLGSAAGSDRLRMVENALSPSRANHPFVDRTTSSPEPWNVVILGQIQPEKGQDLLIEIAPRLPGFRFHVVGRAPPHYQAYADDLRKRAPSNVVFHGWTDDPPGFIRDHNILISLVPSRWEEPFGLVALEGMALSCLTITSRRGALPDLAAITGALTFGSTEELIAILMELRNRPPQELAALAQEQHRKTTTHFTFDRFAADLRTALAIDEAE